MFGYVLPVKAEMKVRDFESYRAVYCGLCKQLGKSYGVFSRFLLNYDLVLLAVTADALSGEAGCVSCDGCFANPLARRPTLYSTGGLALAADGLVMLSYHKLRDNLSDESFWKRVGYGLLQPFARRMYRKAAARRPQLAEAISQAMGRQLLLETAHCASVDEACEPTALMCQALFAAVAENESDRRILSRLGLFAGQVVYLLDAAEDYAGDQKNGRYNVFIEAGLSHADAIHTAQRRCRMAAGEIALCYNLLNIRQYKDILDNIFFLGLPMGIAQAGTKRNERKAGHGQIESV
ncbi:MAG: DUF5685 family protein [Oscillospiraceae bacterium]